MIGVGIMNLRIELPASCCKWARKWVANGGDLNARLEFYRGEVLSLEGPAWAFAKLTIREDLLRGPEFAPYRPFPEGGALRRGGDHTAGLPSGVGQLG